MTDTLNRFANTLRVQKQRTASMGSWGTMTITIARYGSISGTPFWDGIIFRTIGKSL
jgi:hypothetical protein